MGVLDPVQTRRQACIHQRRPVVGSAANGTRFCGGRSNPASLITTAADMRGPGRQAWP